MDPPPPTGPTLHASHSVGVPSAHSNGCTSHQPASTRRAPHSTHTKHTGTHNVHHTATAQVPHTPVPTRPRVAPIPSNRSTTSLAHGRWLASTRTHSRSSAARGGRPRCNKPPSPASLSAASISCPLRGYVSGGLATPPKACTGAIQRCINMSHVMPRILLGQALFTRNVCVVYLGERIHPI